jgi:hypothetical protein
VSESDAIDLKTSDDSLKRFSRVPVGRSYNAVGFDRRLKLWYNSPVTAKQGDGKKEW